MGSRVVARHVLQKIDHEDLRVYMVWLPIFDADDPEAAASSAQRISDNRVTHYWGSDLELTQAFKGPIGLEEGKAWDIFVLYDADALWADTIPKPSSFMHQRLPLPEERTLDARDLAKEVRALLPEARDSK